MDSNDPKRLKLIRKVDRKLGINSESKIDQRSTSKQGFRELEKVLDAKGICIPYSVLDNMGNEISIVVGERLNA